jgi:hypothetical protein
MADEENTIPEIVDSAKRKAVAAIASDYDRRIKQLREEILALEAEREERIAAAEFAFGNLEFRKARKRKRGSGRRAGFTAAVRETVKIFGEEAFTLADLVERLPAGFQTQANRSIAAAIVRNLVGQGEIEFVGTTIADTARRKSVAMKLFRASSAR